MKCLVTGGAGFIGSHVVDELVKAGHEVVVYDDLSGGDRDNVNPRATLISSSILSPTFLEYTFKKYSFDWVYHLAAYAAEGLSPHIKRFNYLNNVIGSVNLINLAVNYDVKHFTFASSAAVYGDTDGYSRETDTPRPMDSYGIAKWTVEQELRDSRKRFGLRYSIFRMHNVYGERQNIFDKYRNVIGIFLYCLKVGKPLPVFGDGLQTRCFTHISDVAPILARGPELADGTFNIGSEEETDIIGLARHLQQMYADKCSPVEFLPARPEAAYVRTSQALLKSMGWPGAQTRLEVGLPPMARWADSLPIREVREFADIEIRKGLPWTSK